MTLVTQGLKNTKNSCVLTETKPNTLSRCIQTAEMNQLKIGSIFIWSCLKYVRLVYFCRYKVNLPLLLYKFLELRVSETCFSADMKSVSEKCWLHRCCLNSFLASDRNTVYCGHAIRR